MTLCAALPLARYLPYPDIPTMPPGLDTWRRREETADFPPWSPDKPQRLERKTSQFTSPKRPRLSAPTDHQSVFSDTERETATLSPLFDRPSYSSSHTVPLQLPSVSALLGRNDSDGDGVSSAGVDRNDHGGTREDLKRLTIGPSSFRRPVSHGDSRDSKLEWTEESWYNLPGPSTAPLPGPRSLQDVQRRSVNDVHGAMTIDGRRRRKHGRVVDDVDGDPIEHRPSASRQSLALPHIHPDTPRQATQDRTSTSHPRQTSLAPPSYAWFSPTAPPAAWTRDNWGRDEQMAYKLGFEDAMRSVESGIVGVMGQQYRNPLFIRREIPSAQIPGRSTFGAGPSRPPGPPPCSPQRPHTAQLPARNVHWPHQKDHPVNGLFAQSGSSSHHRAPLTALPHPSLSLTRGYDLSPLTQPQMFSVSPESTSPLRLSMTSSLYSSSPSGESSSTLPQHHGPRQGFGGPGPGRGHRQLISCYPCRAKKLKCDGQKPCSQCVRRKEEGDCAFAELIKRRGKAKRREGDGSESQSRSPIESRVEGKRYWEGIVPKVEEEVDMAEEEPQCRDGDQAVDRHPTSRQH